MTPSAETQGLAVLRQLTLKTLKAEKDIEIHCHVPAVVAFYLLNTKREELLELETKRQVSITIEIDPEMVSGQILMMVEGCINMAQAMRDPQLARQAQQGVDVLLQSSIPLRVG